MKYKVGDKVRITKNVSGYCFKIGEIVKITEVDTEDNKSSYGAMDKYNRDWWFGDSECELIK